MNFPYFAPIPNSSPNENRDQNCRPTLPTIKELGILPECYSSSHPCCGFNPHFNGLSKANIKVGNSMERDVHRRTRLTFQDVPGRNRNTYSKEVHPHLQDPSIKVVYVQNEHPEREKAPFAFDSEEELLFDPNEAVDPSEWSRHIADLGKEKGKGPSIFECTFPVANGADMICKYRGLKQSVKRHINAVHLKQRPWVCLYCFKRFPQKTTAGVHIGTIHSKNGKWLHPCEYCTESFKDPARRYKHTKEVHPEKIVKSRRKDPYAHIEAQLGESTVAAMQRSLPCSYDSSRSPSVASSAFSEPE